MASSTTQVEWLNSNSLRAYPFSENSTRIPVDESGNLMGSEYAVPNYLFVDLLLSLPYSAGTPDLFLSSLTLSGGMVTAVISAYSGSSSSIVGSVTASASSPLNTVVKFSGSGEYEGAVGSVIFGDLAKFESSFPDGIFFFNRDQTTFEARCVRPSARCVSGIATADSENSYSSKVLYGVVSLIAGENVKLSYIPSKNAIRIDVDENEGYNEKCDCDGSASTVKTINGISITDVRIEGGDCISVETSRGRITITDTCAKPCCGCEELNFLNTKSNELITATSRLTAFANDLESRLPDFKTNFLETERSPTKTL